MNKFILQLSILLLATYTVACNNETNSSQNKEEMLAEDTIYNYFNEQNEIDSTLLLHLCRLNERCGEWGGDLEWVTISKNPNSNATIKYEYVDLCSKDNYCFAPFLCLERDCDTLELSLTTKHEILIKDALVQLKDNRVTKDEFPVFGNMTQVLFSDSSLIIQGTRSFTWPALDSLITEIKENSL
ncbi:hypothetical protein K6119_00390 [Paracrocinitomix mangrovi]|uniref:hypothetical protein n=1 Tax=Paracrocinitomix mangrovi TaxID=2862509 RepID=UPI001C8EA260|nr:hypothetical protein [Paracrocinitomix mangrovi]UKN01972.1 hypothetical protein K6119_00390 [Paracrocinitomix mangrovi]